MIDNNFRAKVTDFGLSAKKKNSASGTPYWMAPELLKGECSNNEKSDIYAMGILMFEGKEKNDGGINDHLLGLLSCLPAVF